MNSIATGIEKNILVRWGVLIGITVLFVIALYPNLVIKEHTYQLGDVAERNIKAPKDFFVEDQDATREKRIQAIESVLTVYDHDKQSSAKIAQAISQGFALLRSIYTAAEEAEKANQAPLGKISDAPLAVGPLADPAVKPETPPTIEQALESVTDTLPEPTPAPKPR